MLQREKTGWIQSVYGYLRVIYDTRATQREYQRIGLTDEILAARAQEIDAATPAFAQIRGRRWAEIARPSAAFLALLRRVPDNAGADAVIAEFQSAGHRGRV